MVLLGMVPVLIQTPPTTLRISTRATRLPFLTADTAARCPEGPDPMTSKSYVAMFSDGVYLARLLLAYGIDPVTRTSYPSGDGQDMNLCMACTVWAGKEPNRDLYDRNVLLYAITDRHLLPGDEPRRRAALASLARAWARGGIDYLQIREKDLDADELLLLAREVVAAVAEERTGIKVLLNGPAEIALEAGAD